MEVTIGHTPDADDAFMFYGMVIGRVRAAGIDPRFVIEDIEALNRRSRGGALDVTAVSFHAYAYIHDAYDILTSGSSVGDGYGPLIVAKEGFDPGHMREHVVAVPGLMTSAYLAARLALGEFRYSVMRFDRVMDAVLSGEVDAGIVIHEGQITHDGVGLVSVLDLGRWWKGETGLPLPLGCNVVRRSMPDDVKRSLNDLLKRSILHALNHRGDALTHAMAYARGMTLAECDRFVSMYVNEYTIDLGTLGKRAVADLLRKGHEAGIIAEEVSPRFVG